MTRNYKSLALIAIGAAIAGAVPLGFVHALETDAPKAAHAAAVDPLARASASMAAAASNFWAALTPEQQGVAGFEFKDEERFNWHFIPRVRKGLTWNAMTPAQQALGHALLSTGLSQRGYQQASTIMSLEAVLKELEHDDGKKRDAGNYAFSIFGTPSPTGTWGWRVEGHHLSVHFTISDGKATGGPVFMGTNPAEVREGPRKGLRVLDMEEDLGFKLVNSLTDDQKKTAIVEAIAPKEILTANAKKADPGEPKGIAFSALNEVQQKQARQLVEYYARRLRPELANNDLAKIDKAGYDKIHFAWEGVTEPGKGHYYRLHGPTFLVEFDNTQNNANHIHTVWRDAANDFGEDILKEHYQNSKHGEKADH